MTDDEFWNLIATLGGHVDEAGFDGLRACLAVDGADRILGFAECLDRAIRDLDRAELRAQAVWDSEDDLLADAPALDSAGFLDARAAVVCAGREIYRRVGRDPRAFGGVWDFAAEMLLYVPVEAFEEATGTPWPGPLPGTDEAVAAHSETVPTLSTVDGGGGSVAISRPAWWLVEVAGAYEWEPIEGFLADPAPSFSLEPTPLAERPTWPEVCTQVAFPAASTTITTVMRAHGGLPPLQLGRLGVVLTLADAWDLDLVLRPFSGSVRVAAAAVQRWSEENAVRAVSALAAHVVIEMVRDYGLMHPAIGDLTVVRDGAADLIPVPPREA
jgi:hypothetical protein